MWDAALYSAIMMPEEWKIVTRTDNQLPPCHRKTIQIETPIPMGFQNIVQQLLRLHIFNSARSRRSQFLHQSAHLASAEYADRNRPRENRENRKMITLRNNNAGVGGESGHFVRRPVVVWRHHGRNLHLGLDFFRRRAVEPLSFAAFIAEERDLETVPRTECIQFSGYSLFDAARDRHTRLTRVAASNGRSRSTPRGAHISAPQSLKSRFCL